MNKKAGKGKKSIKRQNKAHSVVAENPLRLLHELQVHRIEPETQNEELIRARAEAEMARDQYTALFDNAPIGYFILDERGLIRQANLSGAALVGRERRRLAGKPFARLVAPADRPQFAALLTRLWEAHVKQTCELSLLKGGRSSLYAHFEASVSGENPGGVRGCMVAVTDITGFRNLEQALQKEHDALEQRVNERTSELKRTAAELEQEINFEKLVADLSARFVNVPSDQLDREIEAAQRRVCECLGLNVSALWQWPVENPRSLVLTHSYRPPGFPPIPQTMDADDYFPWCQQQVLAGKVVAFSSVEELPAEAARDQEVYRQYGLRSSLNFPLSTGGAPPFAALSFNDVQRERTWSEELVERLQMVAQIFANALARQRSDRRLRESEERLSLAADSAGAGLWSLNLSTGCYWLTEKCRELFGFPPGEPVTFDRFLSLIHAEDKESVRETVRTVVQSKSEGRVQYRIVRPDGRLRWISSRGRVRCKESGESDFLMGVSLDITEQKRIEAALRENDVRLVSAIDIAGLGFYQMEGLRVSFMDDRFRTILGIPPTEEPRAREFWLEHLHPEDRPRVLGVTRDVLEGGVDRFAIEYRYLHPVEGPRWFRHLSRVLERNAAGQVARIIGVVQDITDRKNAEEELTRLRLQLWHADRVAQTAAITASLAHELSQPLSAILNNAEAGLQFMARGNPDLEEIHEILADIVQDGQRAGAVMSGLRSMLRRKETGREKINLADMIRRFVDILSSELLDKQVQLRLELEPDILVLADKAQVQQVILNLVRNAVEAMQGHSAAQRRADLTLTRNDAGEALVAVRDSGPGIPKDCHGRVFDPFWTTKQDGLGIGLVISRSIIESHKGRLWFANNPDQGVTFYFTLPLL